MTPEKLCKITENLFKDVEDGNIFGKSLAVVSLYVLSLKGKPNKTSQYQIMASLIGVTMELIPMLAKQNNRIQALQSSLAQLTKRVNDIEGQEENRINEM